ncbi:hypothetical protein ACIRQP_30700 [Streptomyces sp. NPDC102274]|uniref:hypothetical protein n=1 Tax=Streptomyces sp. NPDC102274 TaxID=3366151 RepID=UPI0037F42D9B
MAEMKISGSELTVEFSRREQTWLHRSSLTVPLASVRQVTRVDRPLSVAHGTRNGLVVSGFAKIGFWGVMVGPRQLVAAYRGKPGLHILLDRTPDGEKVDELVLSLDDADQLAELVGQRRGKS